MDAVSIDSREENELIKRVISHGTNLLYYGLYHQVDSPHLWGVLFGIVIALQVAHVAAPVEAAAWGTVLVVRCLNGRIANFLIFLCVKMLLVQPVGIGALVRLPPPPRGIRT